MPKELLIMRHAKSSWDDESLSDHDRPLNKRGLRDAPRMGQFLVEKDLIPDLVISSSANRAKSTAEIICSQLDGNEMLPVVTQDFYLANPDIYLETLSRLSNKFCRPMVVGHNPGLEHLVFKLAKSNQFMSTCAVAHMTFEFDDWCAIDSAFIAELKAVYRPKECLEN